MTPSLTSIRYSFFHSEDPIAHFLGLLFVLERYENEVAHRQSPWTPAAWGQAFLRLFCDDLVSPGATSTARSHRARERRQRANSVPSAKATSSPGRRP